MSISIELLNEFEVIYRAIKSCVEVEQLDACNNMIANFEERYQQNILKIKSNRIAKSPQQINIVDLLKEMSKQAMTKIPMKQL